MYVPVPSPPLHQLTSPVTQTIGGAFFVSAGESAFTNILASRLPITAPSVDVASVVATGATELRNTFAPELIPGIVSAYMQGLRVAYAVAIAAAVLSVLISLGSKWRNLKGKVELGVAA